MGDTENGSWTSRELGRHINEEQVRAVERVGHTPGPWNVGWSHWPTDEEIAYGINRGKGTVSNEEAVANARLIAAAPELLAALTNIALLCESNIENVDGQEILRLANAGIERTHDAPR